MPRCPAPCRIPIQTCRSPWRRASCAVPGAQVLGVGFRPLPDWTPMSGEPCKRPATASPQRGPSVWRSGAQTEPRRGRRRSSSRQAYGEIVALTCFTQPSLEWARERLETLIADQTMEEARAGAALTAAHLWNDPSKRESACDSLTRLLAGGDPDVWKAVSEVFRLVDELTPDPPTISLLEHVAEMDIPLQAPGCVDGGPKAPKSGEHKIWGLTFWFAVFSKSGSLTAGSLLPAMKASCVRGLRRVTRRAGAQRRSRGAA